MNDIKQTIHQILGIIQLPIDQQEEVVLGLLELINEYTMLQLLKKLSQEDQIIFKESIRDRQDKPEFVLSFIKKYYETSTIEQAVNDEAKRLICDYLHTLSPMMSQEERNQINEILDNCFQ